MARREVDVTDWKSAGAKLGKALAGLVPESGQKAIRESYAKKFGKCRRCDEPLGGPSPEQVCEDCHADELLEAAGGDKPGGDA